MRSKTEVDRTKLANEWNARGFSCGLWVDPPGMIMEGALEIEMHGKIRSPSIGEEILIPAHTQHTVRNIGGTTARWLYGYKS
jgi:hypothetical protein